jgi:hypothetical protein
LNEEQHARKKTQTNLKGQREMHEVEVQVVELEVCQRAAGWLKYTFGVSVGGGLLGSNKQTNKQTAAG